MSLKHALLGFINYGPMTGYELKKFFDTSVAHFWNAELSQIYPALKSMESDGLVQMQVDVQDDRPNRKVYSITDQGRGELRQWLAQPAEPEQIREPILIKVFFGASLPKQELIEVLRDQIEQHRRYLQGLEQGCAMIVKFADAIGLQRDAAFWNLTIDCGMRMCNAEMQWAEAAIQTIEQMDESAFGSAAPDWQALNVRTATDIINRLMTAAPDLFTSSHRSTSELAETARKQPKNGNPAVQRRTEHARLPRQGGPKRRTDDNRDVRPDIGRKAFAQFTGAIMKQLARSSWCTLATASANGEPHVVGVNYAFTGGHLYFLTAATAKKVRNIRENAYVAVCIPVRKYPMGPPFTIQFQGVATVLEPDDPEITSLLKAGKLKEITRHGIMNKAPDGRFIKLRPAQRIHTYGLGIPILTLIRDVTRGDRTVVIDWDRSNQPVD